ncbi:MAG: hypothetical protein [Gammatorquevirus sp.]|nr:MAG: hypothetical protein [Gammatorquevirus sp.]
MSKVQAKDFYTPTPYNQETKNQIWMSQISDSHDNFCNCHTPFAHLLASIFPVGHQDRNLTINQILLRDYREKCRSGGIEEESPGGAVGEKDGPTKEKTPEEEDLENGDIEELLDAVAAAEEHTR